MIKFFKRRMEIWKFRRQLKDLGFPKTIIDDAIYRHFYFKDV